ncbi:MAG: DUF1801 domain-containing protein [Bacteroidia bacterium]|nr:DUF1801 domain-containing protein [Bacteroidia bacterium]
MGKVAVIKTKENNASVESFINTLKTEQQRKDSLMLIKTMEKLSKEKAKMWGSSMIGFGNKRYKSPTSGREVDWFKIGFSPRKANLSIHLVLNLKTQANSLKKLGKHKAGVGCLYINKLEDVDLKVLEELISESLKGK